LNVYITITKTIKTLNAKIAKEKKSRTSTRDRRRHEAVLVPAHQVDATRAP